MDGMYIFPDTNFFLHCIDMKQIKWAELCGDREITLVITRPVQKELDQFKASGNGHRARRARLMSSLMRELLMNEGQPVEANTSCKLTLDLNLAPDGDGRLDLSKPDDQLAGIARAFSKQNPDLDVCILTSDTGLLATTKILGLKAFPVPDDWFRAPEISAEEKKIRELTSDLRRLQAQEPQVRIRLSDRSGPVTKKYYASLCSYAPLANDEISRLLGELHERLMGPQSLAALPPERAGYVFIPADRLSVEKYENTTFPNWLDQCRVTLASLHEALNDQAGAQVFHIEAENHGTRAAYGATLTVAVEGDFLLEVFGEPKTVELPPLPQRPVGTFRSLRSRAHD